MKMWMAFLPAAIALVGCQVPPETPATGPDEQADAPAENPEPVFDANAEDATLPDPPPGATHEGDFLLGGTLRVEKIVPHHADRRFAARVYLKNRTGQTVFCEYRFYFLDRDGRPVGDTLSPWRFISIDPFQIAHPDESCDVRGAVWFRLAVRGSSGESFPNPPLVEPAAAPTPEPEGP